MIKQFLGLGLVVALAACQPKAQPVQEASSDQPQPIVHEEYQGEEPTKPEQTEFYEPQVPRVDPTAQNGVPSDAIVLFDGTNLEAWQMVNDSTDAVWHLNDDGSITVKDKTGDIQTRQSFGDVQLHIEWKCTKCRFWTITTIRPMLTVRLPQFISSILLWPWHLAQPGSGTPMTLSSICRNLTRQVKR